MDEPFGFDREGFQLVGLVDDQLRNACLEWLGCTETELWSAIAVVGSSAADVRDYLARKPRGAEH